MEKYFYAYALQSINADVPIKYSYVDSFCSSESDYLSRTPAQNRDVKLGCLVRSTSQTKLLSQPLY